MDEWTEPRTRDEAEKLLEGETCPVCASALLMAVIRYPIVWTAHCAKCGSEVPLEVLKNRQEWLQKP